MEVRTERVSTFIAHLIFTVQHKVLIVATAVVNSTETHHKYQLFNILTCHQSAGLGAYQLLALGSPSSILQDSFIYFRGI